MSSPLSPQHPSSPAGSYFAGLVDFRFTRNMGPRVIYTVLFVLIMIVAVFFFIGLLSTGRSAGVALAIIGVPIITLVYTTLLRLSMEMYDAALRISANTARTAQLLEMQVGGGQGLQGPGGYGPPPGYGSGPQPGPLPGQGQGYGPGPGQNPGSGYGPPPGGQYPYGPA